MSTSNDRSELQAAVFEVLDNQLRADDPPETRATIERLRAQGIDESEARRLIACVIAAEIFAVMKTNTPFNRGRFVGQLAKLPDDSFLDDLSEPQGG